MSLFRPLLPQAVLLAEADPRPFTIDHLHPLEQAEVARAVPKRQREYAAGRTMAAKLLAELGAPQGPLLAGPDRAPVWPEGVVGSITHCVDRAAVAVARADAVRGLGLDVEPAEPLPPGVERAVVFPVDRLAPEAGAAAGRLLFCAKEAFYKSVYPITRQFLDFHEVSVVCRAGEFVAELRVDAPPFRAGERFQGQWRIDSGWIGACVVLG